MAENKTRPEPGDVKTYLEGLTPARRREDGLSLLANFERATGLSATLWTGGIVGFGCYRYRYASGRSGEAARVGFAVRAGKISLYCHLSDADKARLLPRLGPHDSGVGCIYLKRLESIDQNVLQEVIKAALSRIETEFEAG